MALALLETKLVSSRPPSATFREATPRQRLQYHEKRRAFGAASVFNFSTGSFSFRLTGFPHLYAKASPSENSPNGGEVDNEMLDHRKVEINTSGSSFLGKLAIAVGIAATVTIISLWFKMPTFGPSSVFPYLADVSSVPASSPAGLTLTIFGYRVQLPEYTPGWIYFWLLMAAGCGLFISEEALNIWVCPFHWCFCLTKLPTVLTTCARFH
ncbi:hypothetical protein AAC387_Pa02g3685 [Persea americana]